MYETVDCLIQVGLNIELISSTDRVYFQGLQSVLVKLYSQYRPEGYQGSVIGPDAVGKGMLVLILY